MIRFSVYTILLLALSFLFACDDTSNRGIDSKEVKEEIQNREIKYITQPQIIDGAFKHGQLIADTLQLALTLQMQKAIAQNNLADAAKYCNLQELARYKTIQKEYNTSIQRIRLKGVKKGQDLNEMEKQLTEAYQYNLQTNIPLETNVQKSGTAELLFTSPILVNNTVCLKCHGKVGEQLSGKDYQLLKETYEMDSLINYSLKEPMAIWSISFQTKDLIKRIQAE